MTRIKKSLKNKQTLENKVCFFCFILSLAAYLAGMVLFGSLLSPKAYAYYNNEFIPYFDNVDFQRIYNPQIIEKEFNFPANLPAMNFADFQPQAINNYFIYDSFNLDKYINRFKAYIDSLGVYKTNKPISRNSSGYLEETNPEEERNIKSNYFLLLKHFNQESSEQYSTSK